MRNFFAFIQARSTSNRLPGKVLKPIAGKPIITHIIDRIKKVIPIERIILVIPKGDLDIIKYAKENSISYFEGSYEDVRDRFIQASKEFNAENVIRLTADNPFIDLEYLELLLETFEHSEMEIASFSGLPIGMGVEIFKISSIQKEPVNGIESKHREHVSLHLKETDEFHFLKLTPFLNPEELEICSQIRLTIDEEPDYSVCDEVYSILASKNPYFGIKDIINLFKLNPSLFKKNQNVNQISFKINSQSPTKPKIFILYAEPTKYGSGHYERCKSLSVFLQCIGYSVTFSCTIPKEINYDLFIIDHRDIEIPPELKNQKILLVDHFGQERYSYFPHDLLPHMFNEFEDVIQNSLFQFGIEDYKDYPQKKQVLIYAGNLDFRSSYLLDRFAFAHFQDSGYQIIRVGGVPRKKANFGIKTLGKTNKTEFLKLLAESEFFISYFGQSVMDASFLNKKILLYAISDYHERLALHFTKNSEAIYFGNVSEKILNFTASYQKFLRQVDLNLKNKGLMIIKEKIQKILYEK